MSDPVNQTPTTIDQRALIRRAIADPGAVVAARWPEESGPAWSARAVEQALLTAGWRPPLSDSEPEPGSFADAFMRASADTADMDVITARMIEAGWRPVDVPLPTAPQVFFPGDMVPAGVSLITKHGDVLSARAVPFRITGGLSAAYIELPLPSLEEWQAAVDRAKVARGLA